MRRETLSGLEPPTNAFKRRETRLFFGRLEVISMPLRLSKR